MRSCRSDHLPSASLRRARLPALLGLFTVVLAWFAPRPGWASDQAAAEIAVKIEGRGADEAREAVLEVVPEGVSVADEDDFRAALARAGLPGGRMAYAVTSPRMRRPLLKIIQRAVVKEGLDGAVVGRVAARRGRLELVLLYVEAEGDPLVDTAVSWGGSADERHGGLEEALGTVLEELAPEPEPEPVDEPEIEEPAEDESEDEDEADFQPHRPGTELFGLDLAFGLGGRFFSYGDAPVNTANLRPYETFGAPIVFVGGELYPGATTGIVVLRDVGLTLAYAQPFGLGSRSEDGQYEFDTSWNRFWGGLVYRIPIGGEGGELPIVLRFSGRAGFHNFTLEPADEVSARVEGELPTAEYVLMRFGLGVRIPAGEHFAVLADVGYAAPLAADGLYERFSSASSAGFDGLLGFAIPIDLGFELRAGLEYTGIFSSFEPAPGDAFAAESAADHLLMLHLGMAYLY